MKAYEKPLIRYFDLRIEERIATGSVCIRSGKCEHVFYKGPSPFSDNIVDE